MKKYTTAVLAAVMVAMLFSGCRGSRNEPTEMPGSGNATQPTTEVTMPTLPDMMPDTTNGTDTTNAMDATGGVEETTDATDVIEPPASRSRGMGVN